MTDEKYQFYETQAERSNVARSSHAKYTKSPLRSGSNTKSGPCTTYDLSKPMCWQEFRYMPTDLQGEYIDLLIERHGARAVDAAEMFGCGVNNLSCYLNKHKVPHKHRFLRGLAAAHQSEVWQNWMKLNGAEAEPAEQQVVEPKPAPVADPVRAGIVSASYELVGSPAEVIEFLQAAAIFKTTGTVRVVVNIKKEE